MHWPFHKAHVAMGNNMSEQSFTAKHSGKDQDPDFSSVVVPVTLPEGMNREQYVQARGEYNQRAHQIDQESLESFKVMAHELQKTVRPPAWTKIFSSNNGYGYGGDDKSYSDIAADIHAANDPGSMWSRQAGMIEKTHDNKLHALQGQYLRVLDESDRQAFQEQKAGSQARIADAEVHKLQTDVAKAQIEADQAYYKLQTKVATGQGSPEDERLLGVITNMREKASFQQASAGAAARTGGASPDTSNLDVASIPAAAYGGQAFNDFNDALHHKLAPNYGQLDPAKQEAAINKALDLVAEKDGTPAAIAMAKYLEKEGSGKHEVPENPTHIVLDGAAAYRRGTGIQK